MSRTSPMIHLTEPDLGYLGYAVTYFRAGRGCVVWDESEAWIGVGADSCEARRAAVAAMLPSHLARVVVEAMLAERRAENLTAEPEPTALAVGATTPTHLVPTAQPTPSVEVDSEAVATDTAPVAVQREPALQVTAPQAQHSAGLDPVPGAINTGSVDVGPEPTAVRAALAGLDSNQVDSAPESVPSALVTGTTFDMEVAIEAIDAIENAVAAAEPELAMMAPEMQRLQIFAWVARARAIAEALGDPDDATRRVGCFVPQVRRLARLWWPGGIDALRLAAVPTQSLRGLVSSDELSEVRPLTWGDAAQAAERLLAARLARVPFDGGWSDMRTPRIDAADADADADRAARDVDSALNDGGEKQLATLVDAARRLRSVRRSVTNPIAWAVIVGKLRQHASRAPGRCTALLRVLDPATVPTVSWVHELRHERRPEVEAALRAARSTEQLARALIGAFDVLDTPALAKMLADRADEVACITDDMLSDDRRTKRRLADLKRALNRSADSTAVPVPDDRELPVPLEEQSPIRLAIRERFGGKRVLFVGNREDPELKAALTEAFGFALTWCVAGPRRVDAAREKIAGGAYDLVLAATGFLRHTTDVTLARAAGGASVPYVRVDHGRVSACEQAIARECGLTQAKAA